MFDKLNLMINNLRDLIDEKDEINAKKSENERERERLTKQIIEELEYHGLESAATDKMSISVNIKSMFNIKEKNDFITWAVDNGQLGAVIVRANNKVLNELMEESNEVATGVELYTKATLNTRRK